MPHNRCAMLRDQLWHRTASGASIHWTCPRAHSHWCIWYFYILFTHATYRNVQTCDACAFRHADWHKCVASVERALSLIRRSANNNMFLHRFLCSAYSRVDFNQMYNQLNKNICDRLTNVWEFMKENRKLLKHSLSKYGNILVYSRDVFERAVNRPNIHTHYTLWEIQWIYKYKFENSHLTGHRNWFLSRIGRIYILLRQYSDGSTRARVGCAENACMRVNDFGV